jgi:hypothetical protein
LRLRLMLMLKGGGRAVRSVGEEGERLHLLD